mgnify:CR=1 FL=1
MKKITLFIAALAMSVMSYALNPFAYALSSSLSEDGATLTVKYSLNAAATAVNVVVLDGEEIVKTVDCSAKGLVAGAYTAEIATEGLPTGKNLTWKVEVKGTSVTAPTQETKIYSLYHPSAVDIDNNPENETFGLILSNEAMQSVASKTSGYISAGFGAGIFAFTPAFDPIMNGDKPGFKGGNTFTNGRYDASGSTAYAPRRIRISEDGRIFVTSLNTDGTYLWEVNPKNLDEWTPVFKGTRNDKAELVDAEGNFIAGPNVGFDVKGSGENLQLLMMSSNLSGFSFAYSGYQTYEYNLGTATSWSTAPTKKVFGGKYIISFTSAQVEYDNEGGVWICQNRSTATDAQPSLVHINAAGVEDYKEVLNARANAGIRFNNDFSKLIIATSGKKATIYTLSKDTDNKPVLTQETEISMTAVGTNLNDFAFDYAGNLYACGNSSEKLAAWAMPYSGQVVTPAAAKYAFELDVQHHTIEITNLVVTPNGEYELLEGSEKTYGIAVALNVDANGNIQEGSNVSRDGQALPIVSSSAITKTYDEALATDVYTATILVKNLGGVMGLDLTMYNSGDTSDGEIDVVITDAQFTIETYPDGMGGTYQVVDMTANWKDGTLSVMGLDLNQKGFMMMNYQTTSDFFSWMCYDATVQTINNVVTITGQFECMYTHNIYNVNISGELPNSETDLENTPVEAVPVKIIRDGQLLIMKNGVQYNANGAQL